MDIFNAIKEALCDILDIDGDDITPETYIIRDLDAESIDLLELGVVLNSKFNININDDEIFLGSMRMHIEDLSVKGGKADSFLKERYPYLTLQRINEILNDLESGPVLKIKDIMSYVSSKLYIIIRCAG